MLGVLMSLLSALRHPANGDLPDQGQLPGFGGATGWLNAQPLSSEGLRGRVVAVQFWTYTCVNWLRTLPYVRAWNEKFGPHGLTIVGVHTPEFEFERKVDNIVIAARDMRVAYPIAVDSEYRVWRDFSNQFWPALYVADVEGRVRYTHHGEGEYAMSEMVIQQLLLDAGREGWEAGLVSVDPQGTEVSANWNDVRSPESYLGYAQSRGFDSPDGERFDQPHQYSTPRLSLNRWAPIGNWTYAEKASVSNSPNARIAFQFHARDVNLVMGPVTPRAIPFRVYLDGTVAVEAHGTDVDERGNGTLAQQRLYQLIRQSGPINDRLFEIEFLDKGAEVYCFTFG
jgi:thiol-disulfide isomerase/thioredoxin